jgi:hypothetical protein
MGCLCAWIHSIWSVPGLHSCPLPGNIYHISFSTGGQILKLSFFLTNLCALLISSISLVPRSHISLPPFGASPSSHYRVSCSKTPAPSQNHTFACLRASSCFFQDAKTNTTKIMSSKASAIHHSCKRAIARAHHSKPSESHGRLDLVHMSQAPKIHRNAGNNGSLSSAGTQYTKLHCPASSTTRGTSGKAAGP